MPSSTIHVLWLCRKPCGVSPSLDGSQHASGASSAGVSLLPGQWSPAVLWAMILPSRRSRTAYPHDGQRPVFSVPISRGVPLPDGGANRSPGTAGGHEATGMPGHAGAGVDAQLGFQFGADRAGAGKADQAPGQDRMLRAGGHPDGQPPGGDIIDGAVPGVRVGGTYGDELLVLGQVQVRLVAGQLAGLPGRAAALPFAADRAAWWPDGIHRSYGWMLALSRPPPGRAARRGVPRHGGCRRAVAGRLRLLPGGR